MVWTTTSTLTTDLTDSVITEWDKGVLLSYTPELVCMNLATVKIEMGVAIHTFTKYDNLTLISSALTEDADATSVVPADTAVTLTPAEYGNVITRGKIVNFQTGGKVDTAAAMLVGRNMGASVDKLGITALEAFSTTRIYPNTASAASNLTEADVLDKTFANRLYNKLARLNVAPISGSYFGIAHDDCLYDLRDDMVDISKYQDLTTVLQNEVGMFGGIRWLRSSNVTTTSNSSGTIDSYKVNVLGFNALGFAAGEYPHPVISGPFDKLGRWLNIGWYGIFVWGVIDTAAMVQGICASSVGANT